MFKYVALFAFVTLVSCQDYEYQSARPAPARIQPGYSGPAQAKPTPIPILKQINRHNEDGSYTYGYEGADGSFKIETKLPTGEVKGKYGYVDDTGKVRVVEYGATKYGFEPSGEGITVAPPTLVDDTTNKDGLYVQPQQDDYAQYEQPQQVRAPAPRPSYDSFAAIPKSNPAPARASIGNAQSLDTSFEFVPHRPAPQRSYAPAPAPVQRPSPSFSFASPAPIEENTYEQPAPRPKISYAQPAPQPRPQYAPQSFAPQTQAITRPQPQPQQQYVPRPAPARPQQGGRSVGVLDQLAKDYALPQGGAAALHDISFGYY